MKIKVSKVCIALLSVATIYSGVLYAQVKTLDSVAAIVNDDVIMQSQLNERMNQIQRTASKNNGQLPAHDALVKQVLDQLILEDLQLQLAKHYGITVDDEELKGAIAEIAQRNGLTPPQFEQALKREGLTITDVAEQVRHEIMISRVRQQAIGEKIRITDQEVNNFLNSEMGRMQLSEEYDLASILIPVRQGSSYAEVQKAEAKAISIYNQLKKGANFQQLAMTSSGDDKALDGGNIGWRKAAQLPPPFDKLVDGMKVGDFTQPVATPGGLIILKVLNKRGGNNYLQDQISVRHILLKPSPLRSDVDTQKLADRLYQRIEAGEDFGALAKKFSEDPASAQRGGSLNWIDPNALVPEFRKEMDTTPVGTYSKPFRSRYGWHILQVEGRRSKDNTAEYRKQQAMNILYDRKYLQELPVWLQQLRDEAYIEVK